MYYTLHIGRHNFVLEMQIDKLEKSWMKVHYHDEMNSKSNLLEDVK